MKKQATNARIVVADTFQPVELLALSKAIGKALVDSARETLKTGVYAVDVVVRIKGDIEVGIAELTPGKFSAEPFLLAALNALDPGVRKKVLARPVLKKADAAVMKALLQEIKDKRKKVPGPAKLTPHLVVTPVPQIPVGEPA